MDQDQSVLTEDLAGVPVAESMTAELVMAEAAVQALDSVDVPEQTGTKKKKKNPFAEEKLDQREWHERLGDGFWRQLYRSAVMLEEMDRLLSQPDSPCVGYVSQADFLPFGLSLVSVLDYDDFLFLPRDYSLASIHRGLSVEQYVGQWRGNLLDPGKGRLPPGNIANDPFHLVPGLGAREDQILYAHGIAMSMRLRGHNKVCLLPLIGEDLADYRVQKALRLVAETPAPLLFISTAPDAEALASAAGLRFVQAGEEEILSLLKSLKQQVDRTRSKAEPVLLALPPSFQTGQTMSEICLGIMNRRSWAVPAGEVEQVHSEVRYGIERALMIPKPPKKTVIQDVRVATSPALEAQWQNWRKIHGK